MDPIRVARIQRTTGTVVNVEMAHTDWIDAQDDPAYLFIACPNEVGPGWTWGGTQFIAPSV